jgi:hypothetical protein
MKLHHLWLWEALWEAISIPLNEHQLIYSVYTVHCTILYPHINVHNAQCAGIIEICSILELNTPQSHKRNLQSHG